MLMEIVLVLISLRVRVMGRGRVRVRAFDTVKRRVGVMGLVQRHIDQRAKYRAILIVVVVVNIKM